MEAVCLGLAVFRLCVNCFKVVLCCAEVANTAVSGAPPQDGQVPRRSERVPTQLQEVRQFPSANDMRKLIPDPASMLPTERGRTEVQIELSAFRDRCYRMAEEARLRSRLAQAQHDSIDFANKKPEDQDSGPIVESPTEPLLPSVEPDE